MPSETDSERAGLIKNLDSRTKLLGLVTLVLEGTLLGSLAFLPLDHRLIALIVCAVVLTIMVIGMIVIELKEPKKNRDEKDLPSELKGNIIEFDREAWNAPGDEAALYRTASSLKFAGKYEEAINFYRRTLAIAPNHSKAKYNIGSCFLYLKELRKAEEEFKKLIDQLKDENWQVNKVTQKLIRGAYMQLNSVCDASGKYKEGEDYLLKSLQIVPDDALAYANLAICTKKAGDDEAASKWYQVLMEHPDKVEVLVQMSDSDKKELDGIL